jgi:hypothetical protein
MRIEQAYISQSVADFPFIKRLNITPYIDSERPSLFIGCYTDADFQAIMQHKSKAVVVWCGQDALECILYGWHNRLKNVIHVTWLTNIERALRSFLPVRLVPPVYLGGEFEPSVLGNKIFAYAPQGFPEYHGFNVILKLIKAMPEYQFLWGDGLISQKEWLLDRGNSVYNDCFIGLCLSGFAGGGQTIIQMGLKGMPVINNVLNCPNSIAWDSIESIKKTIEHEARKIGTKNTKLANMVSIQVNKKPTWLEV